MKKAFSIPLVILLLFVSVFPCFAEVNYASNLVIPLSDTFDGFHYSIDSNSSTLRFNTFNFSSDRVYYLRYNYISGNAPQSSHSFYIFIQLNTGFTGVPMESRLGFYDYIYTGVSNISTTRGFSIRSAENLKFDLVIFDITDLYATVPDLETVRSDLSFFVGSKNENQVNNLVINPFVSFFSHIFEPFQYIAEIGQTGYFFQPLILIGAVLGILVFIFVCVFLFKRFTGGKT